MKKRQWHEIILRAIRTFIQAAIAYAVPVVTGVGFFEGNQEKAVFMGVLISASAAGISAVWNTVFHPLLKNEQDELIEIIEEILPNDEQL